MKRQRSKSPIRLTRDAERLIAYSTGIVASHSRREDRAWERELDALAAKLMDAGNDLPLESALDHTLQSNPDAHDALAEALEAQAESCTIEIDGQAWDLTLLGVPVVAWSRYSIPAGPIAAAAVDGIAPHLYAHVLAGNARLAISPFLYSIDQMPRDYSGIRKLTVKLGEAAIEQKPVRFDFSKLPETAPLLADSRFLLVGVAVRKNEPLFRWQEFDAANGRAPARTDCLARWVEQGRPHLARLLTGCSFECGLPDAYFGNCRDAERRVRPYAIRAAVSYLESTLKTTPERMRAVIAGIGEERIDEYRIGFAQVDNDDVIHGVVWPLFGSEEDDTVPGPRGEIETVLKECKISEITWVEGMLAPEYCEDCGAPLFSDRDGEMVHPELPEEVEQPATHYH
ncbi:MAG: DUF2863 family protein [Betaproteobacteria bacterium]|nr:DUF2863 family protein [Betaproteobacteria bacterium]